MSRCWVLIGLIGSVVIPHSGAPSAAPVAPTIQAPPADKKPPSLTPSGQLPQAPPEGNPFLVAKEAFERGGYLNALLTLQEKQAAWESAGPPWSSLAKDMLGTYAALAGEHQLALASLGALDRPQRATTEAHRAALSGYRPVEAAEAILRSARGYRVVMMNEEHLSSVQRAFANRVLEGLHRQGFRYLAVEAINEPARDLNARGYPLANGSGLYTRDPALGDLLRRARALGFTLVHYEVDPATTKPRPEDKGEDTTNRRERGQAQNLYDLTIKADPKAKVVVWAGRGHIAESQVGDWTPMGFLFKQISGLDPLTVDLTSMVESARPEQEWPEYRAATEMGLVKEAVVFQKQGSDKGAGTGGGGNYLGAPGLFDLRVFHPRTRWVEGRAQWMSMGGLRKPVRVPVDPVDSRRDRPGSRSEPLMLQAFLGDEPDTAVPVDQTVIWPGKPVPALMLRAGRYRVRLVDRTGAVLWTRAVRVP